MDLEAELAQSAFYGLRRHFDAHDFSPISKAKGADRDRTEQAPLLNKIAGAFRSSLPLCGSGQRGSAGTRVARTALCRATRYSGRAVSAGSGHG